MMTSNSFKISEKDVLHSLTTTDKVAPEENPRFEKNIIFNPETKFCEYSETNVPNFDTVHFISPATMSEVSDTTRDDIEECVCPAGTCLPDYDDMFASYIASTTSPSPELQRTLAMIKPNAIEYEDVILRVLKEQGIKIIHKRCIHLTPEQVSEIYSQYYGSPGFPHVVVKMSVGPIIALCLEGVDVIERWKDMIGSNSVINSEWFYPISMRKRFGLHDSIPDALHASEDLQDAVKENIYFNPKGIIEPLIKDEGRVTDYCNVFVNPTLSKGLTETVRVKPNDPICFLAEWLLKNNPYQPQLPDAIATLPT